MGEGVAERRAVRRKGRARALMPPRWIFFRDLVVFVPHLRIRSQAKKRETRISETILKLAVALESGRTRVRGGGLFFLSKSVLVGN